MSHTQRNLKLAAASLLTLVAFLATALAARAETTNCTAIEAVPATLDTAGVYCLNSNLAVNQAAGMAITIAADNVVLDLNGHEIVNLDDGMDNTAYGIYSNNHRNITVRNGTVRWFLYGIVLNNDAVGANTGHLVERIRADQNRMVGIYVVGRGNLVRDNLVLATGGASSQGPNAAAYGIWVNGLGPRIVGNEVEWVYGQGTGKGSGIFLANDVRDGFVVGNRVAVADYGVRYFGNSTGKYRDNLTSTTVTPFSRGTDAGGNN